MSSYPKPNPLPLPPVFNNDYFEATNFLTVDEADNRYLGLVNPVVAGNLTVVGSTSLQTTTVNNTFKVGSAGSAITGIYTGSSGNVTIIKNAITSFAVFYGQTITGTKRIFPSLNLVSGLAKEVYLAQIIDIQNTYFMLEVVSKHGDDTTCRIDWMVIT
jgi:hypothetical protein